MAITPDTEIILLKVPIELDNKNQLTFSNSTSQYNYFYNCPKIIADNCTYQRKDSIVRFPAHIDSILTYNYCMYQNEHYSNKWFYCFITDKKYINDNMTELTIKTDVFQTWQFDLTYKRCFVEREHVLIDRIGAHTIPENLEIGDYVQGSFNRTNWGNFVFLINVTKYWHDPTNTPGATNLGNYAVAGGFYLCNTFQQAFDTIDEYNNPSNNVSSDNIIAVYMIPNDFIYNTTVGTNYEWSGQSYQMNNTHSIDKITSLDGYIPKNNKLLTYPYCAILISNNAGSSNTLRPEEFTTNPIDSTKNLFEIKTLPCVGGSCKCSPMYYKNHGSDGYEEEGIVAAKFPTLSWSQDAYVNWLTQNAVNLSFGVATDIGQTIGGIIGGSSNNAISGVMGVLNKMIQVEQQKTAPDSAKGNVNAGDVQTATSANRLYFYNLTIKSEYAKIIDDFFSMYGYKVNANKIPNITGRTNWNYVKTIDSIIIGDVPQEDLQEIKNMFDNGVTLWHNSSTFLDYSQSNNIV